MKSVLLVTPCYDGRVEVPFANNLVRLATQAQQMNYKFDWLCTNGDSNINRARNTSAATFMQTDFQTLAFVDSDIDLAPNDFWRLAQSDAPIRGAAVATKTDDGSEKLSVYAKGEQLRRAEMPREPFPVDYLGSAVLFIDRKVLETVTESLPPFRETSTGVIAVPWFENMVVDEAYLSEDYGFCHLARTAGYQIQCDPSVVVTHYGKGYWRY